MTSPRHIAFIGLGAMGYPMAGHLARAGHEVTVFNRTAARAEAWQTEYDGHVAPTPAAAAKDQDAVMICVGNDDDVREVTIGEHGALPSMREGALLIDHTTTSEALATSLANLTEQSGAGFLDAPVSGGQVGAENGVLTVMVGADEEAFTEALPLIECYAKSVRRMGPVGAGQLTKMVNQICVAGLVQALSEGLNFANRAGLDAKLVVDVISKGAAQSWQMENRGYTMIEDKFNFGFAVDWMRKDLDICMAESKNIGAELPVTQTVAGYYDKIAKKGGNRWDTSSLIRLLKD